MTKRAKFVFKTKESAGRVPIIVLEPLRESFDVLAGGFLGFDLPEGTTINQAEEIAAYLNEKIDSISYTK